VCLKMVTIIVPEDAEVDPTGGLPVDRFAVCPDNLLVDPAQEGSAGSDPLGGQTAEEFVIDYWTRTPLPKPDPYIAPGRAITGMYAYLETRGTTTHTYTEP